MIYVLMIYCFMCHTGGSFLVYRGLSHVPPTPTPQVFYDAEHYFDGFRANPEYALQTLKAALDGGATRCVAPSGWRPKMRGGRVMGPPPDRGGSHYVEPSGGGISTLCLVWEKNAAQIIPTSERGSAQARCWRGWF